MTARTWQGVAFASVPVALGFVPGAVAFAREPNARIDIGLSAVHIPGFAFIAIWSMLFMGMGLAAWQLWLLRASGHAEATAPLIVICAAYLQANTFWLADGLRAIAIADASGVLWAATAVWAAWRCSRRAAFWLLPWLVWMPITLSIKLALLFGAH